MADPVPFQLRPDADLHGSQRQARAFEGYPECVRWQVHFSIRRVGTYRRRRCGEGIATTPQMARRAERVCRCQLVAKPGPASRQKGLSYENSNPFRLATLLGGRGI